MKTKQPKITAKQEGGDDGYCYVVRINGKEFVNGLTRAEVPYYKERALKHWEEQRAPTLTIAELWDAAAMAQRDGRQSAYEMYTRELNRRHDDPAHVCDDPSCPCRDKVQS